MFRMLCCFTMLIAFPLLSWADPPIAPTETVIRLNVQPMAAPKPALRYLLLPDLKELNPGNPIQNYLKCFAEQNIFFFKKESWERRDELTKMPLKDLPAGELQNYGGNALRQADWAARLDKPDWEILLKLKTEGFSLLLPDLQMMRNLASALRVRFRGEVAIHHFDDALRTAKTMFALSRHVGTHPTIIGDLVAIAIASLTISPLEEMLEQPGCPNLYWALTNLPRPFISLELGLQGERAMLLGDFRDLKDDAPMSQDQLKKSISHLNMLLAMAGKGGKPDTDAWLKAHVKDEKMVNAARRRLVEYGLPEERVRQFPAEQVLLLDEKREFEVRRDEFMKLMNLPTWQALALISQITANKGPSFLAEQLIPALTKVRQAQGRLEQRIGLLRHVEALRLYAADHDGKLPETLAEVPVPLPDDPFTGKPFHYQVKEGVAHLHGTPPAGMEKNPGYNIRYEITIRK